MTVFLVFVNEEIVKIFKERADAAVYKKENTTKDTKIKVVSYELD